MLWKQFLLHYNTFIGFLVSITSLAKEYIGIFLSEPQDNEIIFQWREKCLIEFEQMLAQWLMFFAWLTGALSYVCEVKNLQKVFPLMIYLTSLFGVVWSQIPIEFYNHKLCWYILSWNIYECYPTHITITVTTFRVSSLINTMRIVNTSGSTALSRSNRRRRMHSSLLLFYHHLWSK